MALKLNKANAILSKLRRVLDIKTLRSVCYAIFESHLYYASLVLAQNTNSVKRLHLMQKNPLRIMSFQSRNSHSGPLLKVSKILKPLIRQPLKTALLANLLLANLQKGYRLLSSITGSKNFLSHIS